MGKNCLRGQESGREDLSGDWKAGENWMMGLALEVDWKVGGVQYSRRERETGGASFLS